MVKASCNERFDVAGCDLSFMGVINRIFMLQTKVINYLKPKLSPSFEIDDDVTFKKNLIKLNIFYRDFSQQNVTQSADYPVDKIF